MPTLKPEALHALISLVARRIGSDAGETKEVADHLLRANLTGHDSHGVGMLPAYVRLLQGGLLVPNQTPMTVLDAGALLVIDAGRGFGQRMAADAVRRAIGRAKELGACVLALRNASHIGRIGTYAELAARPHRWVWISRIEVFKGTGILAALATMRPEDRFDIFGPIATDLPGLGLDLANVVHLGSLMDISEVDFAVYDGFVFTSLSEGMPNIVLEMSQHAIPMIVADVGGLRDTLDDTAAIFVRHAGSESATADAFAAALDRVIDFTMDQAVEMVVAARKQVTASHAPGIHARRVAELFAAS